MGEAKGVSIAFPFCILSSPAASLMGYAHTGVRTLYQYNCACGCICTHITRCNGVATYTHTHVYTSLCVYIHVFICTPSVHTSAYPCLQLHPLTSLNFFGLLCIVSAELSIAMGQHVSLPLFIDVLSRLSTSTLRQRLFLKEGSP